MLVTYAVTSTPSVTSLPVGVGVALATSKSTICAVSKNILTIIAVTHGQETCTRNFTMQLFDTTLGALGGAVV